MGDKRKMSRVEMRTDFFKLDFIPPSFIYKPKSKTKEQKQAEKEIIQAMKEEARRLFLDYAKGGKDVFNQ